MEYLDEKIVELQRTYQQKAHQDIYAETVFVNDETLHFIQTNLFDDAFHIMLPESFVDMPEDVAKIKYPSEQRPQIIRTNQNGSVNFCFNLYDIPFSNEQVADTISGFQSVLQKLQPGNEFFAYKTEPIEKMEIGWFDFKNYAIDSQIYSLMFAVPIHKKICSGVFNCPFRNRKDWESIMKQVLVSIREIRKREL